MSVRQAASSTSGKPAAVEPPMPLSEMTRLWDKGSKSQRAAILTNFLQYHRSSTAAELDRDLGHGALLFFTRLTAWFRLTYQLGPALQLQLSAMSVFLQGQKYLSQFMEVGGIQALTDLVFLCKPERRGDKNSALLLLLHIANSGRVYREMICDGEGVEMLVKGTLAETDERTLDLLSSLYLALGQGNPRKATAVHSGLLYVMLRGCDEGALCAATTLRSLQLAKQMYAGDSSAAGMVGVEPDSSGADASTSTNVLDSFFHLLSSANVKLRFEGMELLSLAAQNHALLGPVIRRCLESLEASEVSFDSDVQALAPARRLKAACGRILCNIVLSPLPAEQAEQVLLLLERFSAHITLGKHLRLCEGRDVPGSVETCRTLRCLAVGPYATALGTAANAVVTRAVTQWLRKRLGDANLNEFISATQLTDDLALKVAKLLLAAEAATGHDGPQGDEAEGDGAAAAHVATAEGERQHHPIAPDP